MLSGEVCGFGCGRPAVKQLKNGRYICAESWNQCPVMRHKNNAQRRGKNPFESRPHPRGMAGKPAWNRGRKLEECYDPATAERLRECSRQNAARLHARWNPQSEAELRRREKLSQIARQRGLGRYRPGSGRGKKGWYKGYWCDSSYELAFVIYCLDQGLAFERNWQAFPYTFEGRARHWMPDFRWNDGLYIEIKGYTSPQTEAKFAAFPHPLLIIRKQNLQFVFDYVIERYGRDFTRLYE